MLHSEQAISEPWVRSGQVEAPLIWGIRYFAPTAALLTLHMHV